MCAHARMHSEARGQPSAVQVELSDLFLRQGLSLAWNLPTGVGWPVSPRASPVSASPGLGLKEDSVAAGLFPGLLGVLPRSSCL